MPRKRSSAKSKSKRKPQKPPHPETVTPWSSGLIDPLDYVILSELPAEGSMLGYHALGVTTRGLVEKMGPMYTGTALAGRLTLLKKMGFTVHVLVQPVSRGRGWQITPAGQKELRAWQKRQEKTTTDPETKGAAE